jgi:serine/threonine protein kinase
MNRPTVDLPLASALADTETPGVTVSPAKSDDERLEAIYADYVQRRKNGESPDRTEWLQRYPEFAERLERLFGLCDLMVDDVVSPNDDDIAHPRGYRIESELGQGGMAVVFRAQHLALQRTVAIKVLRGGHWGDRDLQRIRREAEAVARLTHPNIVQIYEIAEWNGQPFLALEFVPGGSLADALAKRDQAVDATVAMTFVETLARAMQSAHDAGIVHRDLKPANILLAGSLDGDPQPKIADFGLAITTDHANEANLSLAIAGTPSYMAPEQADGRRADVGPVTDVYGLGAILYELLTGQPPFRRDTIGETLDLVRRAEPVRPRSIRPAVSRDLETICLTCLSKEPARRYRSAVALADDLARCHDGRPILARPVGLIESIWKACRRRPVVAGLATATTLLTSGIIAVTVVTHHNRRIAQEREVQYQQQLAAARSSQLVVEARDHWERDAIDQAAATLAECPPEYRDAAWREVHAMVTAQVASLTLDDTPAPHMIRSSPSGRYAVIQGTGFASVIETKTGRRVGQIRNTERLMFDFVFSDNEQTLTYWARTVFFPWKGKDYAFAASVPAPVSRKLWEIDLTTRDVIKQVDVPCQPGISAGQGTRVELTAPGQLTFRNMLTNQIRNRLDISRLGNLENLCFDPNDRYLATTHPGQVAIHDLQTMTTLRTLPFTPPKRGSIFELHPDGTILYFLAPIPFDTKDRSTQYQVYAWDLKANRELFFIRRNPAMEGYRFLFLPSPDGSLVAVAGSPQIQLYNARTGELKATLRGHKNYAPVIHFSRESNQLFSVAQDRQLKTWDLSAWMESKSPTIDR